MGTPLYLAPEIINEDGYSYKADVWSLGVILYEIMNLEVPFFSTTFGTLLAKIVSGKIPELNKKYSPELRKFVRTLLTREVRKRPTINELLETDFLSEKLIRNKEEFHTLINSNRSKKLRLS